MPLPPFLESPLQPIAIQFGALWAACILSTTAGAGVVGEWNATALAEVRLARLGPPIVARALAVSHTCMYEAWTAYDARAIGTVVGGSLRRPAAERSDANKAQAISFAAYRCLANLFPAGAARLALAMQVRGYDPNDASTNLATPQGIGNVAAQAVIESRRNDGSNQYGDLVTGAYADYTGYAPANAPMPFCLPTTVGLCTPIIANPYRWQPLISDTGSTQKFIAPHWERVKPFALSAASQFDAYAPLPNFLVGPANYQSDVNQLVSISGALSPQQKLIVEYWADGPASELPPGHWGLFAQFVSQRDSQSIDQDVKMFFAMHNASFDAGIAAWHLKRKHDGVRPITAVRYLKQGQPIFAWGGPGQPNQWIAGEKWTPYNPGSNLTPAFAGYISGHSTFSAASAEVLRSFKGSDTFNFSTVIPANFGRVEPGIPALPTTLSYTTFSAAAAEAGTSRLLGGIHFADDNTVGQDLGTRVGQQAWAKAQFLFDGGLAATTSSVKSSGEALTLSWTHTVEPLSNRLLLVGVVTTDINSVNSITYGGLPLTRLGEQLAPTNLNRVELWYRIAPPPGTATVSVRLTGADELVAGAMSFTGVHQTVPFGVVRKSAGATLAACSTLANESAPLVASVLVAESSAGAISPGASQSMLWSAIGTSNGTTGIADTRGTGMVGPGAPVATICQNLSTAKKWALVVVPLKPALQP